MPFMTITHNQQQSDHYKRAGWADMKCWNSACLRKQSDITICIKKMLFFDCLAVGGVSADSSISFISPCIQFSAYIYSTSPYGSGPALKWTHQKSHFVSPSLFGKKGRHQPTLADAAMTAKSRAHHHSGSIHYLGYFFWARVPNWSALTKCVPKHDLFRSGRQQKHRISLPGPGTL